MKKVLVVLMVLVSLSMFGKISEDQYFKKGTHTKWFENFRNDNSYSIEANKFLYTKVLSFYNKNKKVFFKLKKYIKDNKIIGIFREIKVIQEIIITVISKIFNNFTYFKFSILKNNFRIQISKNVNNPPIVISSNRTVKINFIILSPHNI